MQAKYNFLQTKNKLQILILETQFFTAIHNQVTRIVIFFIQIVSHNVGNAIELTLLASMEMSHDNQRNIVITHQIHEIILLIFRKIGRRCRCVIVTRAEQPIVTYDNAIAIFVAMREFFLEPIQLTLAMGAIAGIQKMNKS